MFDRLGLGLKVDAHLGQSNEVLSVLLDQIEKEVVLGGYRLLYLWGYCLLHAKLSVICILLRRLFDCWDLLDAHLACLRVRLQDLETNVDECGKWIATVVESSEHHWHLSLVLINFNGALDSKSALASSDNLWLLLVILFVANSDFHFHEGVLVPPEVDLADIVILLQLDTRNVHVECFIVEVVDLN